MPFSALSLVGLFLLFNQWEQLTRREVNTRQSSPRLAPTRQRLRTWPSPLLLLLVRFVRPSPLGREHSLAFPWDNAMPC